MSAWQFLLAAALSNNDWFCIILVFTFCKETNMCLCLAALLLANSQSLYNIASRQNTHVGLWSQSLWETLWKGIFSGLRACFLLRQKLLKKMLLENFSIRECWDCIRWKVMQMNSSGQCNMSIILLRQCTRNYVQVFLYLSFCLTALSYLLVVLQLLWPLKIFHSIGSTICWHLITVVTVIWINKQYSDELWN